MTRVDMSAEAVTARLRRLSELRRLCLSLQKAKPLSNDAKRDPSAPVSQPSSNQNGPRDK